MFAPIDLLHNTVREQPATMPDVQETKAFCLPAESSQDCDTTLRIYRRVEDGVFFGQFSSVVEGKRSHLVMDLNNVLNRTYKGHPEWKIEQEPFSSKDSSVSECALLPAIAEVLCRRGHGYEERLMRITEEFARDTAPLVQNKNVLERIIDEIHCLPSLRNAYPLRPAIEK